MQISMLTLLRLVISSVVLENDKFCKKFFVNSKFFQGVVKFGDLLIDGARGIAKPLQSLFSMIKSTSTTMVQCLVKVE